MKPRLWFLPILIGAAAALAGCGKDADAATGHGHPEHGHAEGEADADGGVAFEEGRGLRLSPEVAAALGLRTAEAEVRPLAAERTITARVFATSPRVLASARLPDGQAAALERAAFTGARLRQIDRGAVAATGLADLVFELDAAAGHRAGDFVTLALAAVPKAVLTVPRAAVLDGAAGDFVYVVRDGAYLRTPVGVGGSSAGFAEITGGLRAGDTVVAASVAQLWLTELRLTKGGGHSH